MTRTLRINNRSSADFESSIQPFHDAFGQGENEDVLSKPANIHGVVLSDQTSIIQHKTDISFSDAVEAMVEKREGRFVAGTVNRFNQQQPAYITQFKPTVQNRKSSDDTFNLSNKKFSSYERTVGISSEKPLILTVAPFLPLYRDGEQTESGQYVDAQFEIKRLQNLKSSKFVKTTLDKKTVLIRRARFERELQSLKELSHHMLNFVAATETLRQHFDLKNDVYDFNAQSATSRNFNATPKSAAVARGTIQKSKPTPKVLTLNQNIETLGYKEKNIQNFSSTKVWMTLVSEYKTLLRKHSRELLKLSTTTKNNDKDALSLNVASDDLFGFTTNDPSGIGSVAELVSIRSPEYFRSTLPAMTKAWSSMYQNQKFKTHEIKLAALVTLLAKELSYGKALLDDSFRKNLNDGFGYVVSDTSDGNLRMFDRVLGQFSNDVLDVPNTLDRSLSNFAFRRPSSNSIVFTFENKYIDIGGSVLTPATAYYVDSSIENDTFDFTKVETLNSELRTILKKFQAFVNGLGLMNEPDDLTNPSYVMKQLFNIVLDDNGNTLRTTRNDKLTSIYTLANTNSTLKSLLFELSLLRIDVKHENSPLLSAVIDAILDEVSRSVKDAKSQQSQGRFDTTPTLVDSEIKSSLTNGTQLLRSVDSLFKNVIKAINGASTSNRLKHSGQLDSVLLMVVFDMLITCVSKYGNQTLSNKKTDSKQGKITYDVSNKAVNFKSNVENIYVSLEKETLLTQNLTLCIINIFEKMLSATDSFIAFINSSTTKKHAIQIKQLVDRQYVKMVYNEQQVSLFSSLVYDIIAKFNESKTAKDDFTIIDEVPLKLKTALNTLLKLPEFASKKAVNKKLISVGIPAFFTQKLRQESTRKNFDMSNKQKDIVRLHVYKIDALNQDIIYKPKKFTFDMSRFPVRNDVYVRDLKKTSSFKDVLEAIPTRDWLEAIEEGTKSLSYWDESDVNNKNNSMTSESYSFLTPAQKSEIIKNHVISQLLELYMKLMTGLDITEHHFTFNNNEDDGLIELEFVKTMLNSSVESTKKSLSENDVKTGVLPLAQNQRQDTLTQQASVSQRQIISDKAKHRLSTDVETISDISKKITSISDATAMTKLLLQPKQFDRVFHVIIDPDDFEIDVKKTIKSPYGNLALQTLIKRGDIVGGQVNDGYERTVLTQNLSYQGMRFRDKDRSEGDMSFERYFVAIEPLEDL